MISNLAKNIIIKSGNYNRDQIESHTQNFDPVLNELTVKQLDLKANLKRIYDFKIGESGQTTEIVKVFKVEEIAKKPILEFSEKTTLLVEKINLFKPTHYGKFEPSNYHSSSIELVSKGLTSNITIKENLEIISSKLLENASPIDLPYLYELLKVTQVSEILSCTCVDARLLSILGFKLFLSVYHNFYQTGSFKLLLEDLIYKINFKSFLVSVHHFKERIRPYILPTTILILGKFLSEQYTHFFSFQDMKSLYSSSTIKDYKFQGYLGEIIDNAALLLKKIGGTGGYLIKAPIQGFYLSILDSWIESSFDIMEWWLKRK